MNKNLILKTTFAAMLLFSKYSFSREFLTPLPYKNLPKIKILPAYSIPSLEITDEIDETFMVYPSMMIYNRSAENAYGNNNFSAQKNLSALFFGNDNFQLKDIFCDQTVQNSGQPYMLGTDQLNVKTMCNYNETGCILGASAQKSMNMSGRPWTLRLHAHMPIKRLEVNNLNSNEMFEVDYINIPDQSTMKVQIVDNKPLFAVRMDVAKENNIFELKSTNIPDYYHLNSPYKLNANTTALTDKTKITITPLDLAAGQVCGSADGNSYKSETISAVTGTPATCTISTGPTTSTPIHLVYAAVGTKEVVPSIGLYTPAATNNLPEVNSKNIYLAPANKANLTASAEVYFTLNSDGVDATIGAQIADTNKLSNGTSFSLVRENNSISASPIIYNTPPVLVQYSNSGFPDLTTLTSLTAPINTIKADGSFSDDFKTVILPALGFTTVETDGSLTDTSKPGVFMYDTDYSAMNYYSDLYLTSALDSSGNPTPESIEIYKQISNALNKETDDNRDMYLQNVNLLLKGWYVNGQAQASPEKEFNFNNFSKKNIGDLDLECSFGSMWLDNDFSGDIIFGAIIPTAPKINTPESRYSVALGNNGHFEGRIGAQAAYDVNSWIRFGGYAHWNIVLGANETIIPQFKNATVFGIQPATTEANISWQNIVASFDVSCFANQWTSLSMKYQYYLKTKDSISLSEQNLNDASGTSNPLSTDLMREFSKRQSHKLLFSLTTAVNDDVILSLGASTIVAGKNVAGEHDLFVNAMISF